VKIKWSAIIALAVLVGAFAAYLGTGGASWAEQLMLLGVGLAILSVGDR